MKVKRYVVNALPEALPIIRSELGADAVILNTKEIRVGGFLGMFAKRKMEVIAAVDSNAPVSPPPARQIPAAPRQQRQAAAVAVISPTAAVSPALTDVKPMIAAQASTAAASSDIHRTAAGHIAAAAQAAPRADSGKNGRTAAIASEEALLSEIRDMKEWIQRLSKQQQMKQLPESLKALRERLAEQEVAESWIMKLIDDLSDKLHTDLDQAPSLETVWAEAGKMLKAWMAACQCQGDGIRPDTRVVHFVGPTGVGKTTSIAKLAAEQTLKAGRKVGFITADTYRIAAVDQLRTYATILNVPLEVVFSPAEVTRAYTQLGDRELIFMDTAGRNFRNELFVSEVNSLLQAGDRSQTFLVLSLTGKYKDMEAVAGQFAKYGVRSVLFTKQDETHAIGAILNLALEFGFRPEYIAYGQTVPDDISPFRADAYVEQLLGAPGHE